MQAEESRINAWRLAIQEGDAQLERGEGVAYTTELFNDITQSALVAMHTKQPISSESV
jgi:hypothetical protein